MGTKERTAPILCAVERARGMVTEEDLAAARIALELRNGQRVPAMKYLQDANNMPQPIAVAAIRAVADPAPCLEV